MCVTTFTSTIYNVLFYNKRCRRESFITTSIEACALQMPCEGSIQGVAVAVLAQHRVEQNHVIPYTPDTGPLHAYLSSNP